MQRTIGLDFGTHQTKICVEEKDRLETRYSFITFKDNKGRESYVIPSIIRINSNGKLSYGYIEEGVPGTIVRYFKQATFTENTSIWNNRVNAEYYTIWYLAYIIFLLEEKYDTDFGLNFGIPTDNDRYGVLKRKAACLLFSAYRLVEEVYEKDKERFLNESITKLMENTEIQPYSDEKKEEYNILIFPEAFACLRPLAAKGKITSGMNLMVDIGGGTTDISFFTMEKEKKTDKTAKPQIYELLSAPLGLNFLTKAEEHLDSGKLDSNVETNMKLDGVRQVEYTDEILNLCYRLKQKILKLYDSSTQLYRDRVVQALKDRLIIYTGGGSTFPSLRRAYDGFNDIKHITTNEWGTQSFDEMEEISRLCPILSTVFGLSISAKTDTFETKPLDTLFIHIKDAQEGAYDDINVGQQSKSYKFNWLYKNYGELGAYYNTIPKKKVNNTTSFPKQPSVSNKNDGRNPPDGDVQKKLPKGEVQIVNIPLSCIQTVGLNIKMGVFTLRNHSKVKCGFYGNIIICDGIAYDVYYDNLQNLIIDSMYFEGKMCQRQTVVAVNPVSPLYKAIKINGYKNIKNIAKFIKTKKKKTRKIIKITVSFIGPQYPKGSSVTYSSTTIQE